MQAGVVDVAKVLLYKYQPFNKIGPFHRETGFVFI